MYYPIDGVRNGVLAIDIVADGPTFVVKISDWNEAVSIYRQRRRKSANREKDKSITDSDENFEVVN